MKFKVLKGTELYNKLKLIQKKCSAAQDAAQKLGKKLGGIEVYTTGRDRAGGIDAIEFTYDNSPDKEFWMQPDRHNNKNLYYPRNNSKANKVNAWMHTAISELPIVTIDEFNKVIGFESQWVSLINYKSYGLLIKKDYALIELGEKCKYKPLPDMIELTISEYTKLNK